ncbi:MAG: hypothetical protein GY771_04460 [bacterium]|nr:hypothetical protein [bacterium]
MTKRKFDFESVRDFSGHFASILAAVGVIAFAAGAYILKGDDVAAPRYWNVYNTLFAVWLIAELAAFGLGSVTVIGGFFGEWGQSKTGFILAVAAIIVAVCNAVFLMLVLYSYYFGGGQFTLI